MAKAIKKNVVKAKAPADADLVKAAKQGPLAANGKAVFAITDNAASIEAMIVAIGKASEEIKNKISIAAASCVIHAVLHRQITPCHKLIAALSAADGKGKTPWRVNALRDWFIAQGPVTATEVPTADGKSKVELVFDGKKQAQLKKEYEANAKKFASALTSNPFWVAKPEPEFKPFDFDAELNKLITKAKNYESGTGPASKLTPEQKKQVKLGNFAKVRAALGEAPVAIH